MTLQEVLKAQGLTDEQVTAVLVAMKENKIYTASEENLDTRYTRLKGEHDTLSSQYGEATKLIETLKSSNKGNEALQGKITEYEGEIAKLQAENTALKTDNALKFALKDAGAVDVDYLVFKAKEKGEIKLDADGKIKGIDDLISGLKTQIPNMFAASGDDGKGGKKILDPNNLKKGEGEQTVTREQFLKMGYEERLKFKKENPDKYKEYSKK